MSAIHRVEGLAAAFVSELAHFKSYIQHEEQVLENKLYEWKDHVQHYPEELKKRIIKLQEVMLYHMNMSNASNNTDNFITNSTYSRVSN